MAVSANKYDCFVFNLGQGQHDLANDTLKWGLSNTAFNAAHTVWGNFAEITAANGYNNVALSGQNWVQATNISKLQCNNNQVWTATAGNFGPFQYLGLVNNNATPDALNNACLIMSWNYGSSITCNNGESFTVAVPANKLIFSIT